MRCWSPGPPEGSTGAVTLVLSADGAVVENPHRGRRRACHSAATDGDRVGDLRGLATGSTAWLCAPLSTSTGSCGMFVETVDP